MKKIYLVMFAMLFSAGAFAQIVEQQKIKLQTISFPSVSSLPTVPLNDHGSMGSTASCGSHIWIEYDSADAYWNNAKQSHALSFPMNKRFTAGAPDVKYNLFQTCIVRFDSLYDLISNEAVSRDTVASITIDSIYFVIGHQNTSGENDTLIARIINLNASRYPGTTTLWADTLIDNVSFSPNDLWNSGSSAVKVKLSPNYTSAIKGFGIELDYYAPLADTLSFLVGLSDMGPCGICPSRANISNFYPNSFASYNAFLPTYPLIPTSGGQDIIVPCDGTSNPPPGDACNGYNNIQDIVMGAYITINPCPTGIAEELKYTGIALHQNIPNPLHNSTDIMYELAHNAKDVTLSVFDVVGNKIMEVKEGNRESGNHTVHLDASNLAKGMYTYTLRVDGSQMTKRMIIE